MEPNLLQYLCVRFAHVDESRLLSHSEFDAFFETFRAFLVSTRVVVPKCTEISRKPLIRPQDLELPYAEFIDKLMLDSAGLVPRDTGLTNFKTNLLKGVVWERLCHQIGRQLFIEMLHEVTCFLLPQSSFSLTLAPYMKPKHRPHQPARKFHMYYRRAPSRQADHMLPHEVKDLTLYIFRCGLRQKQLPKRYRLLVGLLRVAKTNDSKLNYKHVLHTIVKQRELHQPLSSNATPLAQVTRLVLVVVHRVFPNDTFGCQKNWNIINQSIHEMLKSDRTESINTRAIAQMLEITKIPWLGKTTRPTSKQDLLLRVKTLYQFVNWFISQFVVQVVVHFFYVTENPALTPGGPANSFFAHGSWARLSRLWLREYVLKYLHESHVNSAPNPVKFNCGILRLVPKKADFRPLCTPFRMSRHTIGLDEKSRETLRKEHAFYDYNVMRPIRDILRSQQQKAARLNPSPFPRCDSVRDVGQSIATFKSELMSKFGGDLPPLYGVQFDMKHCYDNLNQAKIILCTNDLFQNDPVSEEYIVRKYARVSKKTGQTLALKSVIKDSSAIEEINIYAHSPATKSSTICGDTGRTFKFTRSDVLDLVRSQVIDATTEIPNSSGSTYTRSRGVFQGFPLLGTLCDIVYNALMDKIFVQIKGADHECVLLRLADDFLFISTSKTACEAMLERARSREAKEYGAHVNLEKVSWIDASEPGKKHAHFLGLTIDLMTLCVQRSEETVVSLASNFKKSLKASLAYLSWRFSLKLSDYLLDLKLLDEGTVSQNICRIYVPTLNCALQSALKHSAEPTAEEQVGVFALEMLYTVLSKFRILNGESIYMHRIYHDIMKVIKTQLRAYRVPTHMLDSFLHPQF